MASGPNVQHHFTGGDTAFVAKTASQRLDVRQALIALHKEFSKFETRPTQVTAEIKFQSDAGENNSDVVYTVKVTDTGFDVNRRSQTRRSTDSDDLVEIRPFKKPRISVDGGQPTVIRADEPDANLRRTNDDTLAFMKGWHKEWQQQGGWLFDTLNRAGNVAQQNLAVMEKKMVAMQDVLGQSINTANTTNVSEFENMKKLIPWLESCRKVNDDKVQAREEKWRSSSATFHDQARRDREASEKRLEEKIDEQHRLILRLAKVNGLEVDDDDRENSLGAQLTAELNMEAARAARVNKLDAISIDDEDDDDDDG